jgi:triacylglycerol esterase/lipase EstA (alpha/beta hydrolase family)
VYLEDDCQARELSNNLPGSYKMEEIFHGGNAHPLKMRADFFTLENIMVLWKFKLDAIFTSLFFVWSYI